MDCKLRTYKQITGAAVLLLSMLCLHPCYSQLHKVIDYTESSGLPQPYVYSLVQDHSGHLWIGTGEGLSRFDGHSFEIFTDADSLCDNFILSSHINDLGAWFGHMNGGISFYDGTGFLKVVKGDLGTGSITDIKTNYDITWAATQSGGIWRIEPDQEPVLYQDTVRTLSIYAFEMLSSTEVLVGAIDGVYLYSLEPETGRMRLISSMDGIPETKIQDMVLLGDNESLYILTLDEGIYIYNTSGYSMRAEGLDLDMEELIEGPQQLFEDAEGNLWIPTFGNGLNKLVRDNAGAFSSWMNFSERSGLPGDNVKFVMQDREQNIWVGMFGSGLVRLVDEAYTYYLLDQTNIDNNIHAVYVNQALAWFGTESGMIRLDLSTGDFLQISGAESGLPADRVTAIAGSPEDELWVGTRRSGLYRWDAGQKRFSQVFISPGNLENNINALKLSKGMLWIATRKGVCKLNTTDGQLDWFTIRNGIPYNVVNDLSIDESGRVWLSTVSTSPSYIENDSVWRMAVPYLEAPLNISCSWLDQEGHAWVGTSGSGLWKFTHDTVVHITQEDGLVSDYCLSLMCDGSQNLWISHREGLSRIRLSDGHIKRMKKEVGIEQDMEFNTNAFFREESGILWFGSSQGVLSYQPTTKSEDPPAPALSITSVSVNGEEMAPRSGLKLRPGRYDLEINYVGVYFKDPEEVTYQYKMEGLRNDWSDLRKTPYVLFSGLPHGKYTFQLRSKNSDGIFNEEPLQYSITIAKPLLRSWWFYLLLIIALISILSAYVKRREYRLRMEKESLEKAVLARTEEVVSQKQQIEAQHDAIKKQHEEISRINSSMTDSITYARRIQRAVFPPEQRLHRYFSESFIFNRPKDIVSGDFFWVARKNNKLVFTVSDCTGHGVPGAFMSMLGITLLNDLVNNRDILEADTLLNSLKNEIIQALRQKGKALSTNDGMDMALCVYDPEKSILQYSGAFNPLVLVRDEQLQMIKADHMPVGIGAIEGRDFTRHEMEIREGDVIYLYTDGFEDQFGGEKNKKFSRYQFRELLLEIHGLKMPEQKRMLVKTLDDWMNGEDQVDDVTVMGIRF
jgi:ligand-binding sensor domain-containing protein/serine phosphatase RsbU (regulator of sigma subunit)